eukprot:JP446423.1.p1 GENE.JP446423.1~~JP446423.1.p1  ORF type:complete len:186 (+),score=25.53 JP446423.1:57-560(+)
MEVGSSTQASNESFLQRKVVGPVKRLLKANINNEKLALSFALGISLGLFPIPGTTFILCFIATALAGVNPIAIQISNLCMTPLELILIPYFSRLGARLLHVPVAFESPAALLLGLQSDVWGTLSTFRLAIAHSIIGWVFFAPFATAILYFVVCLPLIRRVRSHQRSE